MNSKDVAPTALNKFYIRSCHRYLVPTGLYFTFEKNIVNENPYPSQCYICKRKTKAISKAIGVISVKQRTNKIIQSDITLRTKTKSSTGDISVKQLQ